MLRTQILKTTTSEALPLDLDAVKLDLRADSDDEDATIERMIRGAAAFLERRTGWAVVPGRYHAIFSEWPCDPVEIYRAPLRELEAVEYLSALDTWTPVGVENFQVFRRAKSFLISPLSTFERQTLFQCMDSVRFVFTAGFDIPGDAGSGSFSGDDADPHPMDADVATLLQMLVNHWYQNRELMAADNMAKIEQGAGALLGAHRTYY